MVGGCEMKGRGGARRARKGQRRRRGTAHRVQERARAVKSVEFSQFSQLARSRARQAQASLHPPGLSCKRRSSRGAPPQAARPPG